MSQSSTFSPPQQVAVRRFSSVTPPMQAQGKPSIAVSKSAANSGSTSTRIRPVLSLNRGTAGDFQPLAVGTFVRSSLIDNKKERFECVWAKLVKVAKNSPFLQGLPDEFELPSAHAEGRLVTRPGDAEKYLAAGNVALQYVDNRDGCECSIAGLQDSTGRAMGLMPHPERFLLPRHHYDKDWAGNEDWGWGYFLFKSAFDALK